MTSAAPSARTTGAASTVTLCDVIAESLAHLAAMPKDTAAQLAAGILRTAAQLGHAGAEYYLPIGTHLERSERNRRIRAEFNGRNLREVMRKYGVSERTVYRACRRGEQ